MGMSSARDEARQRGQAFKLRLLENVDWISLKEAADELGCSEPELREWIEAGDLLAVDRDGKVIVPAFQVSGGRLLPHLSQTLRTMSLDSPWLKLAWLIAPHERLGGASPLESLQHAPEAVLTAAKGVGIQGGA